MILLKDICKTYSTSEVSTQVLDSVNLQVDKGDFLAIRGPSGCGKSTLLNIIGCLDGFDSGEYFLDDMDIHTLKARKLSEIRNKYIGYIFQAFNLISDVTVLENIGVPLGYGGIPARKRNEIAREMLHRVGLSEKAKSYPRQLSGGQQQRVAIARALAPGPKLILADEPTGNLDSRNSLEIMDILSELNRSEKVTILMVTHDSTVASYAGKSISFLDGKVIKGS